MQFAGLSIGTVVWWGQMIVLLSSVVSASNGDRSEIFQRCMYVRYRKDCVSLTTAGRREPLREEAGLAMLVGIRYLTSFVAGIGSTSTWSCLDECRYQCMWVTVDAYVNYGERVPQFYGKWPFVRFSGMQEPASAIFSLMNGISTYTMWNAFRRTVPSTAPTYYVWNGYALVSMNAWFWSTVFHARDTAITEMLDYFSATSCVLYSFYGLCARILWRKSRAATSLCAIVCCSFFVMHVHYLAFVNFDYGYNMVASVSIGMLNSFGWLVWCAANRQKYVWRCLLVVSSVTILLLLEVTDFSPIWWTFDAHSLWHLGTIPLPLLWYRFLIDDCCHMLSQNKCQKSV